MASYRLDTHGQDDDLEEARFPTREQAQEVVDATEYAGDSYFLPRIVPSDDNPTTTATDYLKAVWADYPGPCPEGISPCEWFSGE